MIPGDPEGVEAAADSLETVARRMWETSESVASHGRAVTADWTGKAADAAGDHILTLSRRTLAGADALGKVPPALREFARQLRTAQREYQYASTTADHQHQASVTAQAAQDAATGLPPTDPTRAQAVQQSGAAVDAAQEGIRDAHHAMADAAAGAAQANEAAARLVNAAADELALMSGTTTGSTSTIVGGAAGAIGGTAEADWGPPMGWVTWPAPDSVEALRQRLSSKDPDELAAYLEAHTAVARRLVNDTDMPPELMGDLVDGWLIMVPGRSIAATQGVFSQMSPDHARRLALLYPSAVGNLDGAPLGDRMAANRVKLAVALDDEQTRQAQLQQLRAVPRGAPLPSPQERASAERVAVYEELLTGTVSDPSRGAGNGPLPHQVLVFDPAGDGKVAELWGTIGADTRHVAVLVPGMTTDITNFSDTSNRTKRLAAADSQSTTAAVAWMDLDLPDFVPAATHPSYAREGAQPLSDFTEALQVPATADITVIGHSYGGAVVGAADAVGLHADRVLLVEPGGAGPDVRSVGDYDVGQSSDVGSQVTRYTMTAPDDPIALAQGRNVGSLGLGADPDAMAGVTRLETGRYDMAGHPGGLVSGYDSHTGVFEKGSTSWNNIVAVVQGTPVVPYTPPTGSTVVTSSGPVVVLDYPYADPAYPGTPPIPVPVPQR